MSDKITTSVQPQGPTEPTGEEARPGTLSRLVGRMVGGQRKARALLASLFLVIALIGLVLIPYATGRGMNVITEMGPKEELFDFVLIGFVAGGVYLVFSFFARYGLLNHTTLTLPVSSPTIASVLRLPPGLVSFACHTLAIIVCSSPSLSCDIDVLWL